MKSILVILLFISCFSFGQLDCDNYTSTGTSFSGYISSGDSECSVCPEDEVGGP